VNSKKIERLPETTLLSPIGCRKKPAQCLPYILIGIAKRRIDAVKEGAKPVNINTQVRAYHKAHCKETRKDRFSQLA
jgi:hypothetical protein